MDLVLPDSLAINAWNGSGRAVSGGLHDPSLWGVRNSLPRVGEELWGAKEPDLTCWRDPDVGWGLVLPDNPELGAADRACAIDAPEPICELLGDRPGSPVFRYLNDVDDPLARLGRDLPDGRRVTPDIARSKYGVGEDRIPYYLLICASPEQVPWDLQYALNARSAVGRLDLDEAGLANYVAALRRGWDDRAEPLASMVIWATDHGAGDMSRTMRLYIAAPLWDLVKDDPDVGGCSTMLDRDHGGATAESLLEALAARAPGMVVTTSHGVTCPLDDLAALRAALGLPVGEDESFVSGEHVLGSCDLYGTVWYAHACCSAGSRDQTVFEDLFDAGSEAGKVLRGVAALGSVSSPLPRALLGAPRPLRAFVGHVEPTFDWTIADPQTRQTLAGGLTTALWTRMFKRASCTVGHAFRCYFDPIGPLSVRQMRLRECWNVGKDVTAELLAAQLPGRDLMSTVILGDPTVRLRFD